MITISFVQGMVTVIALGVIVGIVWAVQQIMQLKHQLESVYHQIDEVQRQLNIRIDAEQQGLSQDIDEIHRIIDSRFDKFETRLLQEYLDK